MMDTSLEEPSEKIPKILNSVTTFQNTNELSLEEISGTTELSAKYIWTIHDFLDCNQKTGECVKSSYFTVGANEEFRLRLLMYPNRSCERLSKSYISLVLSLKDCNIERDTQVTFRASLNNGNNIIVERSITDSFKKTNSLGFLFVKRENLLTNPTVFLPHNKLKMHCIIKFTLESSTLVQSCIFNDFKELLVNTKFSDLTLNVDEKEFKVHKNILAARSPVFCAMIENDMQEKRSGVINIIDTDCNVMQEVLRFIYVGTINNMTNELLMNLVPVADKYDIHGLMTFCEINLSRRLTSENAMDVLKLVNMYNVSKLKSEVLNFIKTHVNEVFKSEAFETVAKSNFETTLLADVIHSISSDK